MTRSTGFLDPALLVAPGPGGSPARVVPHRRELLADTLTPLAAYERLGRLSPVRFLFESVTGGERVSRYSLLGAAPREIYRLFPDGLERERDGVRSRLPGPPLAALSGVVSAYGAQSGDLPDSGDLPMSGGFVGFFGYDLVRLLERLPGRPPDPFGLPWAWLGRFDTVVVFDHAYQRLVAVANEVEGESDAAGAKARLDEVEALLSGPGERGAAALPATLPPPPPATPSLSGPAFQAAVERAKEHIAAGDIFQVVLARRFRVEGEHDPLTLYRALRRINPSPYMVLLEMPEAALVGASPEMLVKKTGTRVETRPIAGTRPRGTDREADEHLAAELAADPKERAEHVMLVDLGRNDLGRICRAGSVAVASFLEIERYSHVMHLVSSVAGELPGREAGPAAALAALLAALPAGTVSGAPKIRAMEIIDELEPEARGPYAGAVGYLSFTGDLDTCITIRTLVVAQGETSVTAGAGIVADSEPAAEQRETENKAAALLAAVELARQLDRRSSP
ncbi:MAG TPA: chorismate-binding protein [Thermoanaerobaculia bacterium]|nr:chorismate-binding protein [Thermoanaerobaculia bacterium]